jgi:hypothetical protein
MIKVGATRRRFSQEYRAEAVQYVISSGQPVAYRQACGTPSPTRLGECGGAALHPDKTRIVYYKDANRPDYHEHKSFDFLGYTSGPWLARDGQTGQEFVNFTPGISTAVSNAGTIRMRSMHLGCR